MVNFRNNRIYPNNVHTRKCRCRTCTARKKEAKIEYKAITYTFYFMIFLLLATV